MKTIIIILSLLLCEKLFAQFPPIAQALYDSAFANDPLRGQYSIDNGAIALPTGDGKSFYLQWFPSQVAPNSQPLLVTIPGTEGTAFDEFYLWHKYAAAKGVGIIALQWYKGYTNPPPNDYFVDTKVYEFIDTALKRIQYPSNKVLFHGFSRGSAISYAVAFRDVQPPNGKNYFYIIFSNAGKADSSYYLYNQINSGIYGHSFFNGKKWGMYCGGLDPEPNQNGCPGMLEAKHWVEANGATVGLFISDPNLGHGGFHKTPKYIDSCLNYYLNIYSNLNQIYSNSFSIFPNPVVSEANISIEQTFKNCSFTIFNTLGQKVMNNENIKDAQIKIRTDFFPSGIYFIQVNIDNKIFIKKLVVINK